MAQQSGIFISNSSSFIDIPVPTGRNLSYFLNANDGNKLYAMKSDRSVFIVPVLITPPTVISIPNLLLQNYNIGDNQIALSVGVVNLNGFTINVTGTGQYVPL